MSAYRFCRTDDIALLVDALNRCRAPHAPDEPPMTPATFKRAIRDLQVWCSSCMVAFSGADPVGVLIGAKRPSGTLIHTIAVHPDHRRQGHGRHLLTSLASKLSILGPPRLVAEVPEPLAAAHELFRATGYAEEARLTDYLLELERQEDHEPREMVRPSVCTDPSTGAASARVGSTDQRTPPDGVSRSLFVIPVTVDDLDANGLLGQEHAPACWERSIETLSARKDQIAGLAVASDERIEAYILYQTRDERSVDIVSARSLVEDGGVRLEQLLARVQGRDVQRIRFPKVDPVEISTERLAALGFRPVDSHVLYAASAGSEHTGTGGPG